MTKIPHMFEKWHQFQDLLHKILKHTLILQFPKPVQLRKKHTITEAMPNFVLTSVAAGMGCKQTKFG